MLINYNASSSENIETSNKSRSTSLYLHNRKNTLLARKDASEIMNRTTTVSHAKNDIPISMANVVMTKSNNIYDNQAMMSNAALYLREIISNDTWNNVGTVRNSEAAIFQNSDYESTIPFLNEGVSNENKLIGDTIITREKENIPKVCQVLEIYLLL